MAPSPSREPGGDPATLHDDELAALFDLAEESILAGLDGRRRPLVDLASLPPLLSEERGVFVTLEVAGELNGCVGTLHGGGEPLGPAVSRLAYDAAFADPRLPELTPADWPDLRIKLSVLSVPEPLVVHSEEELVAQLRPGVDGLILSFRSAMATFLPAVWEKLPDPADFVHHLQHKAGLPVGVWLPGTEVLRYTAEEHARSVTPSHIP